MRRRSLLKSATIAASLGIAGCIVTGGDDANGDRSDHPTSTSPRTEATQVAETPTDTAPPTPAPDPTGSSDIIDTSLETVRTGCGGPMEAGFDWAVDGDVVTISGRFGTPNPCFRATLAGVELTDGVLAVNVAAESSIDDDEGCIQCVGVLRYECHITVADVGSVGDVVVSHPDL